MKFNLKNKVALITGADSGIGKSTAKFLAEAGAHLMLTDIEEKGLQKTSEELQNSFKNASVQYHATDITKDDEVQKLAKKVKNDLGNTAIVVHCAGARGAADDFLKLTDDDWMNTINVDLMGAVRVARAFIPQLQANGWGRMILISSENAFQPYEEESPYNACKAAIINLAKCLSRSYSKEGITFNTVSPAFIETPMTEAMMEEVADEKEMSISEAEKWFVKNNRPHLAMERRGKPEEVAAVIAFLCSEEASFVNGSNYRVDGGAVESAFG